MKLSNEAKIIWRQSYKRSFCLKQNILILDSLPVRKVILVKLLYYYDKIEVKYSKGI